MHECTSQKRNKRHLLIDEGTGSVPIGYQRYVCFSEYSTCMRVTNFSLSAHSFKINLTMFEALGIDVHDYSAPAMSIGNPIRPLQIGRVDKTQDNDMNSFSICVCTYFALRLNQHWSVIDLILVFVLLHVPDPEHSLPHCIIQRLLKYNLIGG